MIIAKVMGTAVASAKHAALNSTKILIICPANIDGEAAWRGWLLGHDLKAVGAHGPPR